MALEDVYERLNKIDVDIAKLSTIVKLAGIAGLLFWGLISYIILERLDDLDSNGESINTLEGKVNIIEYRIGLTPLINPGE